MHSYQPDECIRPWTHKAITGHTTRSTRERRKAWTSGRANGSSTSYGNRTSEYSTGTQGLEEHTVKVTETEEEPPEFVPQEPDESDDEAEDDDVEQEEEDDVPQVPRSTNSRGVHKPDRYAMVTKLRKEKEKDEKW